MELPLVALVAGAGLMERGVGAGERLLVVALTPTGRAYGFAEAGPLDARVEALPPGKVFLLASAVTRCGLENDAAEVEAYGFAELSRPCADGCVR